MQTAEVPRQVGTIDGLRMQLNHADRFDGIETNWDDVREQLKPSGQKVVITCEKGMVNSGNLAKFALHVGQILQATTGSAYTLGTSDGAHRLETHLYDPVAKESFHALTACLRRLARANNFGYGKIKIERTYPEDSEEAPENIILDSDPTSLVVVRQLISEAVAAAQRGIARIKSLGQ